MPFDGTSALNDALPLSALVGLCGCTTSSYGVVASNGEVVRYRLSTDAMPFVDIAKRGAVPLLELPVACVHHVSLVPLGVRYVINEECASAHGSAFIASSQFAVLSNESEKYSDALLNACTS